MCILFFAIESHPHYPLIICANRDEFHHRPTQPAQFWPPDQNILAGKDLQAGGTWLGVNQAGQFAGITNLRTQNLQDGVRSRGELVVNALAPHNSTLAFNTSVITPQWLQEHSLNYNPFNLIFEYQHTLHCFNSRTAATTKLTQGFHAVCNGDMDDVWPKMALGQQALQSYIAQTDNISINELLRFMQDTTQPADNLLPNTGLDLEWERRLSSIFIQHPQYGTRSTTIILKDKLGQTDFYETRFDGKGRNLGQQHFQIASSHSR